MAYSGNVTVSVTNSTAAGVTQTGFGIPAILGYHTRFIETYREYSSLAEMAADGFVSTDYEYKAAQAIFSQRPRPPYIVVGRRPGASTWTVDLTPTVTTDGYKYEITIGTESFDYTVSSDTVAEVIDGLVADMSGHAGAWTATDNTTKLTITGNSAGAQFPIVIGGTLGDAALTMSDVTADNDIDDDIDELNAANSNWYALILTMQNEAEIAVAAGKIETLEKILVYASADTEVKAGTGIINDLKGLTRQNSIGMYHALPHEFANAALVGVMLPQQPGSATWNAKRLRGVTANALTTTQINNILADYGTVVIDNLGVVATLGGQTGSGEWADVVSGAFHWTPARIREVLNNLLLNTPKIPYTQLGLDAIRSRITAVLRQGVTNGLYVEDDDHPLDVSVPALADIPAEDKQARVLNGVTFHAYLAGAIHLIDINGTVSVA